jgi:hypothetical protein
MCACFGDPSDREEPLLNHSAYRELLSSDIVETLWKTGTNDREMDKKVAAKPLRIKIQFEVYEPSETETQVTQSIPIHKKIFGGLDEVVSSKTDDSKLTDIGQKELLFDYLALVIALFVMGPMALFSVLFEVWLVFKLSVAVFPRLDILHPYIDMVATPLEYMEDLATEQATAMTRKIIQTLVKMSMEALRGVAEDVEMGVRNAG